MLDPSGQQAPAEPFAQAVLAQLPLADAVLSLWAYALDPSSWPASSTAIADAVSRIR